MLLFFVGEKMKKILFLTLTFLLVFLIYFFNRDEKIYYVSMGDQISYGINNFNELDNNYSDNIKRYYKKYLKRYINSSQLNDYRVMDLINDIKYNKTIIYNKNEYKFQNLLIKANIITISIGMNDLIYKKNINDISYEYVDQLLKDIDDLFILIRKYNKDKIYFLSFYNIINNEEIINYSNGKLQKICKKNNIEYVDISLLSNYILKNLYPTNAGYDYITKKIITLLN